MNQIQAFINKLNANGVPLLFIRDPIKQTPSVSLTMMAISFLIYTAGLLGKLTKFTADINLSEAQTLLIITSSLYFVRNVNTGNASSSNNDTQK